MPSAAPGAAPAAFAGPRCCTLTADGGGTADALGRGERFAWRLAQGQGDGAVVNAGRTGSTPDDVLGVSQLVQRGASALPIECTQRDLHEFMIDAACQRPKDNYLSFEPTQEAH